MSFVKGNFVKLPLPSATFDMKTRSTLARQLLLYDQRCLVTGAVSNRIQPYPLINTARVNESGQVKNPPMKEKVERVLTRQKFGVGHFSLDSLPNCIALEPEWHGGLDTGSFCITLPLEQVSDILGELEGINNDWDERAKSDPEASRNLNIREDPFVIRECVLLVLRPDLFLPDKRPLLINVNRTLQAPGGSPLPVSQESSWIPYHQTNEALLAGPSDEWFSAFDFVTLRPQNDAPSAFALLVNANSKLQAIKHEATSETLQVHMLLVALAVDAIFHVPKEIRSRSRMPPPSPSVPHTDVSTLDPSAFEGFDYDSEEDDDDPETINGLTFSEMETVLKKVSDGEASGEERADAAMLMLGMAGGHKRSLH